MTRHAYRLWLGPLYLALEAAVVGLSSYGVGIAFGSLIHQPAIRIGGLWTMVSALVVLQALAKESQEAAMIRVVGSFFGALISGIVCSVWGYGYWQLFVVIFISIYLMSVVLDERAVRLSSITGAVIVIIGIMKPEQTAWLNAMARFLESVLGVSIALVIVLLSRRWRHQIDVIKRRTKRK